MVELPPPQESNERDREISNSVLKEKVFIRVVFWVLPRSESAVRAWGARLNPAFSAVLLILHWKSLKNDSGVLPRGVSKFAFKEDLAGDLPVFLNS